MRQLRSILAVAAVALAAFGARAQDVERTQERKETWDYAVDLEGNLWEIDCEKLEMRKAGVVRAGFERPVLVDLAATPDGYLYGISLDALYLVKLGKPEESVKIGTHGLAAPYGMSIAPDGSLLVNTRGGDVYTLDKKTARPRFVGRMGGGFGSSGDIAIAGDIVVSSCKQANGGEHLCRLDPRTGAATDIGAMIDQNGNAVDNVFGLIFRNDVLYGLTAGGDVLKIDIHTAKCTILMHTGTTWYGATDYQRI